MIVPSPPARRTVGALLALCAVFAFGAGRPEATASAGPPPVISTLDEAAVADQRAVRLRPPAPENFPMAVSPRCDILDNFGDPRSGGRRHEGIDILATLGQEVYAMRSGILTVQVFDNTGGSSSLSGNLWQLTANDGTGDYFVYAHLSAFAPGLSKGSVVQKGQLLGWVGDTGNPTAGNYHLHFEIHPKGGSAANPLPLITVPPSCKVW